MPRPKGPTTKKPKAKPEVANYDHSEPKALVRPEIGTQAHFKQKKGPAKYRYDDSLAPDLNWDTNAARELGEWLLARIAEAAKLEAPHTFPKPKDYLGADKQVLATVRGLADAVEQLQKLGKPFLNWSGKAERKAFEVPTLPLFVHERLSTEAILKTLKGHKKDQQVSMLDELFGVTQRSLTDQVVHAYEHQDNWVNRLILGDSLVVMNSLLRYEHLGGQVQMIYMDPPYGVKFGSNFQPFVRQKQKGTIVHNDDESLTREPEMVQAYRDTWEMGLHSYLTYLRDRMLLARDLLTPSGSIFVQISDENLHHVREVMDEVFGSDNACSIISFSKTSGATSKLVATVSDYILWYAKDKERVKYNQLYEDKPAIENPQERYVCVETPEGEVIDLSVAQKTGEAPMPKGKLLRLRPTDSQGASEDAKNPVLYEGKKIYPPPGRHWSVTSSGTQKVVDIGRCFLVGKTLRWKFYHDDFPYRQVTNNWNDVTSSGFGEDRLYAVQTVPTVIQRCILMTTDPGDLVLDPTCGSGTTAFVAEQWGRRWITMDTSRVPLALARQRLLTATYDYHELKDSARGPAGGFIYREANNSRNPKSVGHGISPLITLSGLAYDEPAKPIVLVDRPERLNNITRVCGPFAVEATIPTAEGLDEDPKTPGIQSDAHQTHVQRMTEVLRRAPVLQLAGNKKITLKQVRAPAKTMSLSAEAIINGDQSPQPVAILFGPEGGALSERMVREAWQEAEAKKYTQLLVIGFAIDPKAREFVESAGRIGIPCTWLQATMDLQMGDLLKNMRSSQVFSVCGLPEVKVNPVKEVQGVKVDEPTYEVELLGLDTFDPATMESQHFSGSDVPCWLLDTDYNGLVFRVHQAFFPRTGAWENLKKELRADFAESVWDHLSGTVSAPFTAGEQKQIAVKVIDPRGNELVVVKKL